MGARPSQFRKGGGFLNGVDGTWVDYQWTDEFNGQPFKPGVDPKTKKTRFHSLYFVPQILVDGADEPVTVSLFAGGYDDFEVSDDGHTIVGVGETDETPIESRRQLGAGTAFAKVIASLVEAGFPEGNLPDDVINYEAVIGARCRFVQRKNAEDTQKLGKRKAKDGKEYDRQDLLIDQVYDLPDVEAKPNGKTKAPVKTAAKPAAGKATVAKAKGATKGADVSELSADTLRAILEDKGGSIQKPKLSMAILTKLMKHAQREDVRKFLFNDENLSNIEGVAYDQASGEIALADAE